MGKMLEECRGLGSSFCWGVGDGELCTCRQLQEHGRGSRTVPEGPYGCGGWGGVILPPSLRGSTRREPTGGFLMDKAPLSLLLSLPQLLLSTCYACGYIFR